MNAFFHSIRRYNLHLLFSGLILLLLAFLLNKYVVGTTAAHYYAHLMENDIQAKEKDFKKLSNDSSLIRSLASQSYSEETMQSLLEPQKGYCFFVFQSEGLQKPRLLFWNSQTVSPPVNLMEESNVSRLISLENGYYVYSSHSLVIAGKNYLIEALIPVMWKYFVEIENLRREFVAYPEAGKRVELSFQKTRLPVKSSYGNTLFYLQQVSPNDQQTSNWVIFLVLAGFFLIFWYIHAMANRISEKKGMGYAFLFLFVVLFLLRSASYRFPGLLSLWQFELFDPAIYGSSFVLSSLGDLLINALLVCWLALFVNRRMDMIPSFRFTTLWQNWLSAGLLIFLQVLLTFTFSGIVQSLVADAKISFNVTNFFSLNRYSFVGFVVLATLALSYFFFSQVLFTLIRRFTGKEYYLEYIAMAFAGLFLLTFFTNAGKVELNLLVLIWLIIFMWMMHQKILSGLKQRLNVSEILFWLFVFSFSIAAVIIFENRKIEFEQRKRFAEKLSLQADPASERLLSIAVTYLDNDFLEANFNRFSNQNDNAMLKDSIINKNFSAYIDKYEMKVFTFAGKRNPVPLFNEDPVSYDTLNTIYNIQGKPTNVSDLRYFERSFDKFAYILKRTVTNENSDTLGYFFVLSEPRNYQGDALIPELFRQRRELLPDYSPMYSYAIYNNWDLIAHYNEYPFPTHLNPASLPKQEFYDVHNKTYDELWYRHASDKLVVIVKKDNSFIEAITLFSYLFSTFLFLLALYRVVAIIIRSRLSRKRFKEYWQISIRTQIHSTIIMVSLLSFVVIGIATIIFFRTRYERNNQEKIGRTIQILINDVQTKLRQHNTFNDGISLYEQGVNNELETLMQNMSEIHGTDINLYDPEGNLRVSSNPFIFDKGVLSEKMNPEAYYYLHNRHWIQCITQERMAKVNYISIYSPVRNEDGSVFAYLNVPSYTTQGELIQEISNFLVTIINLNAFIFLIAGAIALFITNRITSSFTLIGEKMRDINLSRSNQQIVWNKHDEIGELVKEYNKMVVKLEESAEALAKSEREGAWRQMARQVAHEIKNPLTPMKLSIQYLQKAIDNNSPNVKDMTANVAKTLVEQIDHLSKIASDFSQFANIGNPRNEVFDLHDLLRGLSSLYVTTEHTEFQWEPVEQRVMLFADKTQLNRLFTNLLQNAVEASEGKDPRQIEMKEVLNGEYITVSVRDNGDGIPKATQEKIFMPNFTTKSSGTGLGLAMSKSIVENAKGEIWFETEENKGTTFYVKLPLLRAVVSEK